MEKVYEDLKKVFDGKVLFRILVVIFILIVVVLIFFAGVIVGFHKASFGRAWGEHYYENFGMGYGPGARWMVMMPPHLDVGGGYFPDAHGATGKIIKIELPNLIALGQDNIEKTILINTDTKIEEGGKEIASSDLKINDFIITIGSPDERGVIEAKFIRVLPYMVR